VKRIAKKFLACTIFSIGMFFILALIISSLILMFHPEVSLAPRIGGGFLLCLSVALWMVWFDEAFNISVKKGISDEQNLDL
jgi:hypothetical protein